MTPDRAMLLNLFDSLISHVRRLPGETDPDRVLEALMDTAVGQLVAFQDWPGLPAEYGDEVREQIAGLCAELAALHESWRQAEPESEPDPLSASVWRDPAADHWPNPV